MSSQALSAGVDESGKGDFFGPLVVAAFACSEDDLPVLRELGVRDGKSISNNRILEIAGALTKGWPSHVVVVSPEDYNRRYKQIRNLNKLLAALHAEAIAGLAGSHEIIRVVVDQFGKAELVENALRDRDVTIELHQQHRGESVVSVAAASILARAEFIERLKDISVEYGVDLPKGAAAQVDKAGRELVRLFGLEILPKVAKIHFKNYGRVASPAFL